MAKDTRKTPARAKRSKQETETEFEDIREQVEESRLGSDAKAAESLRMHEALLRQSVEGLTVDAVVKNISELGLAVSRSLSDVSEKLTEEVRLLASVRDAVALERRDLAQLHKIDVAVTALDQLVQDYAQKKDELEGEITSQRAAWEEEFARVGLERKEQDEALKKQRQREVEDYEYKKALERKKAQDKYEEDMRLQAKKNQEKQEALDKDWLKRETALKEQEDELARLKAEVSANPDRLAKEITAAEAKGRRETEALLEQQILVLKKDAETEKRVAALQVKSLEDTLTRNAAYVATLEKQLADAKQQVQDIAVKAIEGASGARALTHINQIAMEQAKNRPQG